LSRNVVEVHYYDGETNFEGTEAMAQVDGAILLRRIRKLAGAGRGHLTDSQLVQQFVAQRDEASFSALVERHAAMVLRICRGILHHQQDAEDACQAVFLVLARKAHAIRKQQAVGSWLHGVAYRLASRMRVQAKRREKREKISAAPCSTIASDDLTVRELQVILHEELHRLPDKYRAPLLLCYWEGKTRDEAADQLGLTAGAFKNRLDRARDLLGKRLTRRGFLPSAGCFTTLLLSNDGTLTASGPLILKISQTAVTFAAGNKAAVAITVTALAEGVIRTMSMTKCATTILTLVFVGALGTGIGYEVVQSKQPGAQVKAVASVEGQQVRQPNKESPPARKDNGTELKKENRQADDAEDDARDLFRTVKAALLTEYERKLKMVRDYQERLTAKRAAFARLSEQLTTSNPAVAKAIEKVQQDRNGDYKRELDKLELDLLVAQKEIEFYKKKIEAAKNLPLPDALIESAQMNMAEYKKLLDKQFSIQKWIDNVNANLKNHPGSDPKIAELQGQLKRVKDEIKKYLAETRPTVIEKLREQAIAQEDKQKMVELQQSVDSNTIRRQAVDELLQRFIKEDVKPFKSNQIQLDQLKADIAQTEKVLERLHEELEALKPDLVEPRTPSPEFEVTRLFQNGAAKRLEQAQKEYNGVRAAMRRVSPLGVSDLKTRIAASQIAIANLESQKIALNSKLQMIEKGKAEGADKAALLILVDEKFQMGKIESIDRYLEQYRQFLKEQLSAVDLQARLVQHKLEEDTAAVTKLEDLMDGAKLLDEKCKRLRQQVDHWEDRLQELQLEQLRPKQR